MAYPSDVTSREWALIVPLTTPAKAERRSRMTDMGETVSAVLYMGLPIARGGAASRLWAAMTALTSSRAASGVRWE